MGRLKLKLLLLFVFTLLVSGFFEFKIGKFKNTLNIDGIGYNAYLPAVFIYHGDFNWAFKDTVLAKIPAYHNRVQFFTYTLENKDQINKYAPGMAIVQAPFWLVAYEIEHLRNEHATGYERTFQFAAWWNNIFWLLLGIYLFALKLYR